MMGAMTTRIRCGGKPMTAIVLAGGRGRRMRADKAGLDVGGRTLLEHVLAQIAPYFDEVLVSVSPGQTPMTAFRAGRPRRLRSGARSGGSPAASRFIEDETPDQGPIGGLLSGLKSAANEACAVIACDIPDIDISFLRSLAQAIKGFEIAVPLGPSGLHEPLFAIYRKSVVGEIESLLGTGERSILPLYDRCRTDLVRFGESGRLRNLNTREEYEAYLRSMGDRRKGAKKGEGRRGKRLQRPSGSR